MLEGIITPIVTPFHRDEKQTINYEATKQLIDYVINKGVDGIFILGSNGEFHVIDEDEKIEFAKKVVKHVNHRVPVFAGTGACSTLATKRLSRKMEEVGVDALSIISPYFVSPNDDELYEHFASVANEVHIPVILYNIPRLTGLNISKELVRRLSSISNIVGIKDSSRDLDNLQGYIDVAKETNMSVLVGSDSIISQGYHMGASGAIAGMSNVIAEVLVNLYKALKENDEEKAKYYQDEIEVIRKVNGLATMPSILKRSLELANIASVGPARLPVKEVNDEVDDKIKEMLMHYKLI